MNAWIIAEREFITYVCTLSFWVALLLAPLLMLGVLASTGLGTPVPTRTAVIVVASDPLLARETATALSEAANDDGQSIRLVRTGSAVVVEASRQDDGSINVRARGSLPLSRLSRALFVRSLELEAAAEQLTRGPPPVRLALPTNDRPAMDSAVLAQFTTVAMLWITLTGSLGMLLQAVVREKGNRSLETLLAAATAGEIVVGKLLGVGAVSLLILLAWLGSAVAMAPFAPARASLASELLRGLADPVSIARASAIYVLAFAFYGFVTIALGARARDSAAAQNLARPVFAVLLATFFVSLATSIGAAMQLSWLTYVPPFTPFMLLLKPAGAGVTPADLAALVLLSAATVLAAGTAIFALNPGRLALSRTPWARRAT